MNKLYCFFLLCVGNLTLINFASSQVVINEISQTNVSIKNNESGLADDWIEFYNGGNTAINLKNYSITKHSSKKNAKWYFPSVTIHPKSFLIVLCTGKDTILKTVFYHTNFKITKNDYKLVLADPTSKVIDQIDIQNNLHEDHSYGRTPDGGLEKCFFGSPSLKSSNNFSTCYKGYENAPEIITQSGFFSTPRLVYIKSNSSSGTIRYAKGGNVPSAGSPEYNGPISISKTSVVSARTFSNKNLLPSRVVKATYFINEDVELPVFSVTTDSLNLWDENEGMYVMGPNASPTSPHFGANFWKDIEKLCYVEYFDKNRVKQFESNAGLKIFGNYSRAFPQKSLKVKIRSKYGLGEVQYPLIKDKSFVREYNDIILRNGGSDNRSTIIRDAFMQRLMSKHHTDYMAYEPVVVYLNGSFWGFYELREKQDETFIEKNYGVPANQVNFLEHTGNIITRSGSANDFYKMHSYVIKSNPHSDDFLPNVTKMLDIENFVDYFVAETYFGNKDWIGDWTNNIRLWKPKDKGKWQYILWDLDFGLGLFHPPTTDFLNIARYPFVPNEHSEMLDVLLENKKFRNYFINRYADLINTTFHPENVKNNLDLMRNEISSTMQKHYEKWEGTFVDWNKFMDKLIKHNQQRNETARLHIENEFNLVKQVNVELDVLPAGAGKIKISTITPEALPWTGMYFDGVPVEITAIPNPGYSFSHWKSDKLITVANKNSSVEMNISSDDKFTAYFESTSFNVELFPNPAVDEITLGYYLTEESKVSAKIYSIVGQEIVDVIPSSYKQPGQHQLTFSMNSLDLVSGVYLLKMETEKETRTVKITKQ